MSGGPVPGPYDAIVLAGGAARRLGGTDKPAVAVGGRRLLDRVLDAVAGAARVIVVGPPRPGDRPGVLTVREAPPGGGPAAALAAGLPHASAPAVAVLAGDLPFLTAGVVDRLRAELATLRAAVDGVLLADDAGVGQLLIGVWQRPALVRACAAIGEPAGVSMRRLLAPLRVRTVTVGPGVDRPPWWDCDTDDDLRRAEERA